MSRSMHLNLFVYPAGHHEAAWRFGDVDVARLLDIDFYRELAVAAETATFDSVFFADGPSLGDNIRYSSRFRLEPFTWLSAIASATKHIGLIGTASTTYSEPYNLARMFASLDHLSAGRAGWNIVTTGGPQAAGNFGLDSHPAHAQRYARAHEFVEVVAKLWDSWEDGALLAHQSSGVFADTDRIHRIDHHGEHFRVAGPLNTPRSPQGRPVFVQAGSSEDGKDFAARHAEAVFTAHQTSDNARSFYADVKRRARLAGRDPDQLKILPGVSAYIGSTQAEADALYEDFTSLIQPEYSIQQLKQFLGIDLSGYDIDAPIPADRLQALGTNGYASRGEVVADIVRRESPSIRQLLARLATARGHWTVVGTPERVADEIIEWFAAGAADGFNVMPPYVPGGFDVFAEQVVPILRDRGVFRREYEGATLRDHYGLSRPASRYARGASAT